ncbi:DNA excision repair protein ERCC-1 [Thraustotheca clavata]|uniref:DNA excision repair protein ERCC-1 n=1 Tax=Thraustotheca clavata TaxID=74557 RepID=A0A1W0ABN9_9STRA|nr:DNA excision repair protein ERCC-1 [Thraustotheca clavata]
MDPKAKLDSRNEMNEELRYLPRADAFTNAFQGVVKGPVEAPKPVQSMAEGMVVLIHPSQSGNPLVKHLHNVIPQVNADITADYMMGDGCVACFLSVRYHMLHPTYLKNKLSRVNPSRVRVVVCHVDVPDNESALKEINRDTLNCGFTLLLAWSWKEAARYIETLKNYENKPATMIKERVENDYNAQLNDVLTSVRSINKTDVLTLSSNFGSVQRMMNATEDELALCPGIGGKKVLQLLETFNQPFHTS